MHTTSIKCSTSQMVRIMLSVELNKKTHKIENNANNQGYKLPSVECLREMRTSQKREKKHTHKNTKTFRFVDIYKASFDSTQIIIEWCLIASNRGWLSSTFATKLVYNKLMLLHVFVVSFFFIIINISIHSTQSSAWNKMDLLFVKREKEKYWHDEKATEKKAKRTRLNSLSWTQMLLQCENIDCWLPVHKSQNV